jgi:cell division protein ZapA (FtsZ GTPase activity inhibitor)
VAQVRQLHAVKDLSAVHAGGHDEIFQSGQPVLVGVDLDSTYCYLLAAEDQRDGETWAIHLWDLTAQGLQPDYTVADGGKGLRAGQALAWPEVPCYGDTFHAAQELGRLCQRLDNRAYAAINTCDRLERMMHKAKQQHQGQRLSTALAQARQWQTQAIAVADQVRTLAQWLQEDILAFAGSEVATRQALYDFVIDALALLERCEQRIQPLRQRLANQRDALLAFARDLDQALAELASRYAVPLKTIRELLHWHHCPANTHAYGSRALNFSAICAGVSSPCTRSCRYWPTTSTGPVPWWKTSTAACATTFSCAVISARPAFRCCAFSSIIVLICAALSLNAVAKRRHNCSPAKTIRTGWRCSAFSASAALWPKHSGSFVVITPSVST